MPFRNISKPTEDEILAAPPMKTGRAAKEKRRVEKSEGKEMRHEREAIGAERETCTLRCTRESERESTHRAVDVAQGVPLIYGH